MKVLVLGATGGSGRATVQELLDGGHEVTAFSRHAYDIGIRSPRLHEITGDAMSPAEVARAVEGQDAVVVTLGVNENPIKIRLFHRSKTPLDVCSVGTRNAIEAMKRFGVRKLVVESAYGAGETWEKLPLPWKMTYRALLPEQIADHDLQERLVRESGLDWVIARPAALTNAKPAPEILASPEGKVRRPFISRENVARFLAQAVGVDWFDRQAVALSG